MEFSGHILISTSFLGSLLFPPPGARMRGETLGTRLIPIQGNYPRDPGGKVDDPENIKNMKTKVGGLGSFSHTNLLISLNKP